MAGATYQQLTACGANDPRWSGFLCMSTRMPSGAMGVRLKLYGPWIWAHADNFGFILDWRITSGSALYQVFENLLRNLPYV